MHPNENVIILGSGKLGTALHSYLNRHQVNSILLGRKEVDICDEFKVKSFFKNTKPKIVINTAAITNLDFAEKNKSVTFDVNQKAPEILAKECSKIQSKLIHISTDHVFSSKSLYLFKPFDEYCPINVYGESKALGEVAIKKYHQDGSTILRTAWLYSTQNDNFYTNIINNIRLNKKVIDVVNDQFGHPTSIVTIVELIMSLIKKGHSIPILHAVSSDWTSRFHFAQKIIELNKLDVERLNPIESSKRSDIAKRPNYSILCTTQNDSLTNTIMKSWEFQLRDLTDK